jgi:hypothetical protein
MGRASNTNDPEQHFDEFVSTVEALKIPASELKAIRAVARVVEGRTDTLVSAAGYARIRALIEAAHRPSTIKVRKQGTPPDAPGVVRRLAASR